MEKNICYINIDFASRQINPEMNKNMNKLLTKPIVSQCFLLCQNKVQILALPVATSDNKPVKPKSQSFLCFRVTMSALARRSIQEEGLMSIPGLGENKHRPRKYR